MSSRDPKLSIAVVGSGAVGCYYGARLWESGEYNVKFHMRGDHYSASVKSGLNVTSVHGDMFIAPDSLEAYEKTSEMGTADWVMVALKSTSLDAIPELIYPLLHEKTRVLVIMNGLVEKDLLSSLNRFVGNPDDAPLSCCEAVYGGMALLCSNRLGPGRVDHSYAGLLSGGVAASSTPGSEEADREAFESLWGPTSVDIAYEPSLLRGRWKKCMWNLPFNGISVAIGGITVDKIVTDPGLRRLADIIMDETIAVGNADLLSQGDTSPALGDTEKKIMMDLSDAMGPYRTSTMLDLTNRRPMEVEYLFRKPLEKADELGVPCPHLQTVVAMIEALQRIHNLY